MKIVEKRIAMVLSSVALTMLAAATSFAACTGITSLPATISAPGNYCLKGNLSASTASSQYGPNVGAITITADDVVLDLGGYEIKNTNTDPATNLNTMGILAQGPNNNVTVKNGRITGYYDGVEIVANPGLITNTVVDSISVYGYLHNGVKVEGLGNIVRNCQINVGTYTTTNQGIVARGAGNTVVNNDIVGVNASTGDDSIGILVGSSGAQTYVGSAVVENNRISGGGGGTLPAASVGIIVSDGSNAIIASNRISNVVTGIDSTVWNGGGGVYRDNITFNCTTPYNTPAPMVNAGNNW